MACRLLAGHAMLRKTVVLLALAACSSDDESLSPDGGDPGARCQSSDQRVELDPSATYVMRGAAADERGAWALLEHRSNGTGGDLVIPDEGGERTKLLTGIADFNAIRVVPLTVDGRRCVAYTKAGSGGTAKLACEGVAEQDSAQDLSVREGRLVALQSPDGVVHIYGQSFSAYTEVRRTTDGAWRDIEKFESSISSAQDGLLRGSGAVTCLLTTGNHPAIDVDGDIHPSPDTARWCTLASTPSQLGVLTDLGYTTFSGTTFGAWQPTSIASRPLAMVSGERPAAIAVSATGDAIQLVPLPSGEPSTLRAVDASSGDATSFSVVQRSADEIVLFSLPRSGTSYALARSTRCLE